MITARFIDIGVLEPALFHATYAGIAYATENNALPVVMWGRARPHVSLGQSQVRAVELAADIDWPVVTRLLGGGAVWVDESQYCFVLIAPLDHVPARPAEWFEWGLAPAIATYRCFGLPVERRGQDLWLRGRKIAGSGAATVDRCAVVASSFLLRFPVERFARCIASPAGPDSGTTSRAFQQWLIAGLGQAMTDWEEHTRPPRADELRRTFREAVEGSLRWRLVDSVLSEAERIARDEALAELAELSPADGQRVIPHGIRLNAATCLTERWEDERIVREITVDGAIVKRAVTAA